MSTPTDPTPTSPDPLTLPSSPLGTRSTNRPGAPNQRRSKRMSTAQPKSPAKARGNATLSPSKSFVMDLPAESGGAMDAGATTGSPWRVRVTVEAEPRETRRSASRSRSRGGRGASASPGKKAVEAQTRTVKVPLKGGDGGNSSPAKRVGKKSKAMENEAGTGTADEAEGVVKRRKGTPIRRRNTPARVVQEGNGEEKFGGGLVEEAAMSQMEPSTTRSQRGRATREMNTGRSTERSRRLTQAREELDVALKEAVGSSRNNSTKPPAGQSYGEGNEENIDPMVPSANDYNENESEAPGDMTLANNEDFTMVSLESLQSMKQNTSQLLENSGLEVIGEKSALSVSYLPSSPPPASARSKRVSDASRLSSSKGGAEVRYPDLSAIVSPAATAPSQQQQQQEQEKEMSGSSTSFAIMAEGIGRYPRPEFAVLGSDRTLDVLEERSERDDEREADKMAEEDDIWAEEASRSLEESPSQLESQAQNPRPRRRQQQSRSQQPGPAVTLPVHLQQATNDVFAPEAESQKPLRGKIPRTWRRSGQGEGFSYVDSPGYALHRQAVATASDKNGPNGNESGESRRSSGVLTPPSTDDEEGKDRNSNHEEQQEDSSEMQQDSSNIDLTHPDAAGTQLQVGPQEEVLSPGSESSSGSSVASPGSGEERDDTGLFWQTHLPNVYQSQRQRQRLQRPRFQRQKKAMDLSELLGMARSPTKDADSGAMAAEPKEDEARAERTRSPPRKIVRVDRGIVPAPAGARDSEKIVSSPLRKSLLRSSKIGGSFLPGPGGRMDMVVERTKPLRVATLTREQIDIDGGREDSTTSEMESFESKASDERQLLAEMEVAGAGQAVSSAPQDDEVDATRDAIYSSPSRDSNDDEDISDATSYVHEDDEHDRPEEDPMRSYEENLNLASPQKIKVNFNDSSAGESNSLTPKKAYSTPSDESSVEDSLSLTPKKEYPPLFGSSTKAATSTANHARNTSTQSITLISNKAPAPPTEAQPSLFTRLSTTFWSAVIRPTGPSTLPPPADPIYDPLLRHAIRSRYGVLTNVHPWKFCHTWTLHRLLNSCTSNRCDSIVPKTGPLPASLKALVGKKLHSVGNEHTFTFTTQHAHVVEAFMSTLVPAHIIRAIEEGEMDFLGDKDAAKHRGWFGSRHGEWQVFENVEVTKEPGAGSEIQREWVVRFLGNCEMANAFTAERIEREKREEEERVAAEERTRVEEVERKREIEVKRREWERRNGFQYDDDEEEEEDESEVAEEEMDHEGVLPKVRRA